jgi:integrase/recombinase XerD
VLADYIARREQVWANRPVSSYLFVSGWGNRLDAGGIRRTFYALSRQIGLRGRPIAMGHVCTICGMGSLRRHY